MITFVLVLHVMVCIALILIVLLQTGKGAEMGAVFGGGASTLFGSRGAGTFLSKLTVAAAVLFMLTSMYLAIFSSHLSGGSVVTEAPAKAAAAKQMPPAQGAPVQGAPAQAVPAAPAKAAPAMPGPQGK